MTPDEKFIDFIAHHFSVTGDHHRFVVYEPTGILNHVKFRPFRVVDDAYLRSERFAGDLAACDAVIVHFMTPFAARVVLKVPETIPVAWSGWGADYYHLLPGGEKAVLGERSRRIAQWIKLRKALRDPKAMARFGLRALRGNRPQESLYRKAAQRVQVFSAPIPDDFRLIKRALGGRFSPLYRQINYGTVEGTFAVGAKGLDGDDILVGHSAHLSNNHLEAFELLRRLDLTGRKVVVPLSYGDPDYRAAVLKRGTKMLGEHFDPLVTYLPLAEYNARLGHCGFAVMNQRRQQALGNIGTLLYVGAKVFLDERNSAFDFLRRHGATVFSSSELNAGGALLSRLSPEEHGQNQRALDAFWGRRKVDENLARFMDTLRRLHAQSLLS